LGLQVQQQVSISVLYDGAVVGGYTADLIANDAIIVELKAASRLTPEHEAQVMNYLKATSYEMRFLFNFGTKAEFLRRVLDNSRKGTLAWYKPRKSV